MNSTLETLYAAHDSLAGDDDYRYFDWSACTCGHVYRGATGRFGTSDEVTRRGSSSYTDALWAIARACPWFAQLEALRDDGGLSPLNEPHPWTSLATVEEAERLWPGEPVSDDRFRMAALSLIVTAIEREEEKEKHARLNVLAHAQELAPA